MNALNALVNRFREPSTYAGLAALASVFGAPAGLLDSVGQLIVGAAGLLAVLMPEKGAGK